jgi:hypothetical protein
VFNVIHGGGMVDLAVGGHPEMGENCEYQHGANKQHNGMGNGLDVLLLLLVRDNSAGDHQLVLQGSVGIKNVCTESTPINKGVGSLFPLCVVLLCQQGVQDLLGVMWGL